MQRYEVPKDFDGSTFDAYYFDNELENDAENEAVDEYMAKLIAREASKKQASEAKNAALVAKHTTNLIAKRS